LPAILDEVPCWIIPWNFKGLPLFWYATMLDGSQKCSCVGSREAEVTSVAQGKNSKCKFKGKGLSLGWKKQKLL